MLIYQTLGIDMNMLITRVVFGVRFDDDNGPGLIAVNASTSSDFAPIQGTFNITNYILYWDFHIIHFGSGPPTLVPKV